MTLKKFISLIVFLSVAGPLSSNAQETPTVGVASFDKESLPSLNQQLRETNRRLLDMESTQDINSRTSGTLTIDRGGTGAALTDPNADRLFFWDDSETTFAFLSLGTNLSISGTTLNATDNSLGNVVFCYAGQTNTSSALYIGTDVSPASGFTKNLAFWATEGHSSGGAEAQSYEVIDSKWKKISGVDTITVYALIWQDGANGSAICRVTIGTATNSVTGTANQATPEWKTFDIDVSGLTDDTVYDLSVKLSHTYSANPTGQAVFLGSIIGFGS